jgi:hypothetical protein
VAKVIAMEIIDFLTFGVNLGEGNHQFVVECDTKIVFQ